MTDASEIFDWSDDDSVCVHNQPATAVYANKYKQVVIRQEADWNEEHDQFVFISPDYLLTVVHAMLRAAGREDACLCRPHVGGARRDIDREVGLEDIHVAERREPGPVHIPVKERRERVGAALRADPNQSNRLIASRCGVSDKTVAAVRAEIDTEFPNQSAEFRSREALELVAAE
ncbi:hypothetical protein [Methyloceanibacter caenitepidi]|uniref:Uncharacterized protein n=1 Tax=Methyloceanibacter caenitepidi TaxID=1384459 RepID=A0A0A8K5Q2_9HYPH|nr:hypothetical protein [Methyloceanibacter caenitepidi]BAQ18240.1 hypothetical protein GL4_2806 [Methyloceanibacter caenitepidi]